MVTFQTRHSPLFYSQDAPQRLRHEHPRQPQLRRAERERVPAPPGRVGLAADLPAHPAAHHRLRDGPDRRALLRHAVGPDRGRRAAGRAHLRAVRTGPRQLSRGAAHQVFQDAYARG